MTELDVEALEAAIDAVRERNMFTLDGAIAQGIREYLDRTSTHPAPQPSGPVEVKPLEWEERVGVDGTFDAYTSIGHYIATITDDDRGMWFAVGLTQSNYCAPDIDIAKAAAQADFEHRILSALEATPAPEQRELSAEDVATFDRALLRSGRKAEATPPAPMVTFPGCVVSLNGTKISMAFETDEDAQTVFRLIEHIIDSTASEAK